MMNMNKNVSKNDFLEILKCYCDADLVGDVETRRSTTGFLHCSIWCCDSSVAKLHPIVVLSTAEAETVNEIEVIEANVVLKVSLREFEHKQRNQSAVFEDNATAIAFSEKQVKRMKHYQK
mmetsp:Transcript_32585/g.38240  ORF Transcript_32585/g.38240 Transcript_32585/m.38240 type:complete len:120 (+) Transcript_32585:23-382(+)